MALIRNTEFVDQFLAAAGSERTQLIGGVILPFEVELIEQRIADIDDQQTAIAGERSSLAEQSGDSWHDGLFRESDREVLAAERKYASLKDRLHGITVSYPEADQAVVTLGSRVSVNNSGRESKLDIVGFSPVHGGDRAAGAPMRASLEAPIVQAIFGKQIGETAVLSVGSQERPIEIVAIDQQAIRQENEG